MDLGESLLEHHDPHLATLARRESGNAPIKYWEVIVDNDDLLLTIDEQADSVDTATVHSLTNKTALNTRWNLSQSRQRGEEVAIAESTLFDVVTIDTTSENAAIRVDLRGTLPLVFPGETSFTVFPE